VNAASGGPARRRRVEISGRGRFPALRAPGLEPWLERLLAALAPQADSLVLRLVGDRAMRRLNRVYRGQDATTDVLSFPGAPSPDGLHLGDVVVSVPEASRQAVARGHSAGREIRLLALHGILHCLGHDHETDGGEMERLERRLRRRFLDHA